MHFLRKLQSKSLYLALILCITAAHYRPGNWNFSSDMAAFKKDWKHGTGMVYQLGSYKQEDLDYLTINEATICQCDMKGGLFTRGLMFTVKTVTFFPSLGTSTLLPSAQHRFVRFHAVMTQASRMKWEQEHRWSDDEEPLENAWGVFERVEDGPTVALYPDAYSTRKGRDGFAIATKGLLGDELHLSKRHCRQYSVHHAFSAIGRHDGDYNGVTNNCIHYAAAMYRLLGGDVNYRDLCGGWSN